MSQAIRFANVRSGEFNSPAQVQNRRNQVITLLAVAALSSFVFMTTLPLQISFPLSAVLIGGALVLSYAINHPTGSIGPTTTIIDTDEPTSSTTLYVNHHEYPRVQSSWFSWPSPYHAPVGTRTFTPIVHERPSYAQPTPHYHAPVGTRTYTPVVQRANPSSWTAPDPLPQYRAGSSPSSMGRDFFSAARAPVGRR